MDIGKLTSLHHHSKFIFNISLYFLYVNIRRIKMDKKIRIGLDIGIGSIGWAVLSDDAETQKVEDCGVRLFDSSENIRDRENNNQERRRARAGRRLIRRRHHRRERLKKHLENIGLISVATLQEWYEKNNPNPYELRCNALDAKIKPEEITASLIHICNHRGYRDFYELQEDDATKEEKEEAQKENEAIEGFNNLYKTTSFRTPGEFFFKHKGLSHIRNKATSEQRLLVPRKLLKQETESILKKQSRFYPCLTEDAIKITLDIVFSQRDFETGPGNPDDPNRKYKGFLDTIGYCIYYKDKKRGCRNTVLADLYAATNAISQYMFINTETGAIELKSETANKIINHILHSGNINLTELKKLIKEDGLTLSSGVNLDNKALPNAIKYLRHTKSILEDSGFDWTDFINEEQFDISNPSRLHLLGKILSSYQTPERKEKELRKLDFLNEKAIKLFGSKKFSGTSNVSYEYMIDAIEAFKRGETYGNFQAQMFDKQGERTKNKYLPQICDEDIIKNPVVHRALCETRKVLNAIIAKHGSPETIVVEVASDVSRSFEQRLEIMRDQRKKQKENERVRNTLMELFGLEEKEVTPVLTDKYKLYESQGGKCLYSNREIMLERINTDDYEADHIIPFSLILDNTLNNKALVLSSENQYKKQRAPLEYLHGEKREKYIETVKDMLKHKKITLKKYQYCMTENLQNEGLLDEWKSRNINDTRYVTKYIIGYIKNNLQFSTDKPQPIYGIKGGITSQFRRLWLDRETWGKPDKDKSREETTLHHAADAIVIANLTRPYVEIGSDALKLREIYKRQGDGEAYRDYLKKCLDKMQKYYGFNPYYTESTLTKRGRIPSFVPNLRYEVDALLNEENAPITSYKTERKYRGEISAQNAIGIKKIEGELWQISSKPIRNISKKDLDNIYSDDGLLLKKLHEIFDKRQDTEYTLGDYMDETGLKEFSPNGRQAIHKLKIKVKKANDVFVKQINDKNNTILDVRKYYCIEIYKTKGNKTAARGIKYTDITKEEKRLYLKSLYPEDYEEHIMYLFKNEYIEISKPNGDTKFAGNYCSVKNINNGVLWMKEINKPAAQAVSIAQSDTLKKYAIDVLGKKGGEIKCSVPLSSIKES